MKLCPILFLAIVLAGFGAAPAGATISQPVDVALVLAVAVSGSVNNERYKLQRNGYAAAFADPEVVAAVTSGPHHAIAVTFVEWSGTDQQRQSIGWTLIDGRDAAASFGAAISEVPRAFAEMTALGDAIDYSAHLLRDGGFGGARLVIDVSGDGRTNAGRIAAPARDDAVAAGITVNGLPILAVEPDLDRYYQDNVIGGTDAFMVVAHDYGSFADSIRNKVVREVAGEDWDRHAAAHGALRDGRVCRDVGRENSGSSSLLVVN
jgi:hypothetical protein